jgi:putative holliday junction resolvase
MARVAGVDYGEVRVGLAISDPGGVVAQPLDVVEASPQVVADRLASFELEAIVVGLPLRLDGSRGPAAEAAERFAQELASLTRVRVEVWDERLSTVEAERSMRAGGSDSRQRRGKVDKVAASLTLQSFLEARKL